MKLKLIVARWIHKFLQHTELMTENMRSPKTIGLAWVARTLMNYSNAQVSIDIVSRMKLKKADHVLELGVGNGLAIKELAKIIGKKNDSSLRASRSQGTGFKFYKDKQGNIYYNLIEVFKELGIKL